MKVNTGSEAEQFQADPVIAFRFAGIPIPRGGESRFVRPLLRGKRGNESAPSECRGATAVQVIADSDELAELEGLIAEERAAVQRACYMIEQLQLLSTFEMLILRSQEEFADAANPIATE